MIRLYPVSLEKYLKDNPMYLPRKTKEDERLKLYHRYWLTQTDFFVKIVDVFDCFGIEYYTVKRANSLMASLSYPFDNSVYELLIDKLDIGSIKNIVNSNRSYSGAQIRYWFFLHQEALLSKKYEGFISYIEMNSKSTIADDKYYFLLANTNKKGVYKDCKIKLDISKELKSSRSRKG